MRKDSSIGSNHFYTSHYAPQSTALRFVQLQPKHRPLMKKSLNLDSEREFSDNNISKRYRPSVFENSSDSNNAFSHLRSEITNLRTEFSRLIQKEVNQPVKKQQQFSSPFNHQNSSNFLEDSRRRIGAIEFKNRLLQQQKMVAQFQNKNKTKSNILKNNHQYSEVTNDSNKNLYKLSQNNLVETQQTFSQTKIKNLQAEIIKIKQEKTLLQQQSSEFKKKYTDKQKQYSRKNQLLSNDLQQQKKDVSRLILLQKLQKEQQRLKYQIASLQKRLQESEQQMIKVKQRHESQLASLQKTSKTNMDNIIQKYRQTEQQLHKITAKLQVRQQEIKQKSNQVKHLKDKQRFQSNQKKQSANLIYTLSKDNSFLKKQVQMLQNIIHQLEKQIKFLKDNNNNSIMNLSEKISQNIQSLSRLKQLQQENADLKKRSESFKKTIEQFNNSNNNSRQKKHILHEENKFLKDESIKIKQEIKMLFDQLCIKESLISNLYRDINILDSQLYSCKQLKVQLNRYSTLIEQLNNRIIVLELQKVKIKYP